MLVLFAAGGCGKSWHQPETIAASPAVRDLAVALGDSGHAVAVWNERADPDDIDTTVWAVYRDRDGTWTGAQPVGTGHEARVAVDPAGSAVAVWAQGRFETSRVWASRYTPGRGWSAAEPLADAPADSVDVAMDADGNALAVFDQDLSISARRHDGVGWRPPEIVATATGGLTAPEVAMNAAGDAFVSWTSIRPDGADDSFYLFLVSHAGPGGGWSDPVSVGGLQTSDKSVAVDADGKAYAFWKEQNNGAWFARLVILAGAGTASDPVTTRGEYAVAAGDGDAIAVWQIESRLEVSRGDTSGWDPPDVLDERTVGSPRIAMNDPGEAIVVWLGRVAAGDEIELRAGAFR